MTIQIWKIMTEKEKMNGGGGGKSERKRKRKGGKKKRNDDDPEPKVGPNHVTKIRTTTKRSARSDEKNVKGQKKSDPKATTK
jgi:hypothetical protein